MSALANRPPRLLQDAAIREAIRVVTTRAANAQQQQQQSPNWASRHPVILGTLIGAGIGGAMGAMSCDPDSYCLLSQKQSAAVGAMEGAALGALTGWIVSLIRR